MIKLKKNVGKTDAMIRYFIGVVLIILAFVLESNSPWYFFLLLPAIVSIVTGYLGTCGLYALFGINTCKIKEQK